MRLQFYFNAHTWLGRRLERRGIDFTLLDNAFIEISDYDKAQRIAERLDVKRLHRKLDTYSRKLCPVVMRSRSGVHWSIMQSSTLPIWFSPAVKRWRLCTSRRTAQ